MKRIITSTYTRSRKILASIGVGVIVAAIIVVVQLAPIMNWFNTVKSVPKPTPTEVPIVRSIDKPCEKEITHVDMPGKVKRLVITSLSMGLPVIPQHMENGTWKVDDGVANYAIETSPFNGDVGNSVLYGHNLPQAFRPISKLKKGEEIQVQTSSYQFTYEVYETSTTAPKNVDVMKPGTEKQLTLITCNGLFDEKRLIVKARLKKITQLNCQRG